MPVQKVVIWGATGQALVVEDILRLQGEYEIAGYLDNLNTERKGEHFGGATVLGGEEILGDLLKSGVRNMIFTFANGPAKLKLAEAVKARGFTLVKRDPSLSLHRSYRNHRGRDRCQVASGGRTANSDWRELHSRLRRVREP
jgi:PglD N-terminal domain